MRCPRCNTRMVQEEVEICGCFGDSTFTETHCPDCGYVLGTELKDEDDDAWAYE